MPLNLASTALPKPERLRQSKISLKKTEFDIYKKNSSSAVPIDCLCSIFFQAQSCVMGITHHPPVK